MARTDPMTWRSDEKRWTKWYGAKSYNVSPRQLIKAGLLASNAPQTKEGTRAAMRRWWEAKERELTAREAEPAPPKGIRISNVGFLVGADGSATDKEIAMRIEDDVDVNDPRVIEYLVKLAREANAKADRMNAAIAAPSDRTIGPNVEAFLAFKRGQAEAGERSLGRADAIRLHLERFKHWIGADQPVEAIGESAVRRYYEAVLDEAKKGDISRYYARDLFASFRQFARWLTEQRLIPVPLNLHSKDFSFKLSTKVRTFTDADVKLILEVANDRMRLYVLLMLNCGFTQVDVAELAKSRIDLKQKQIMHKRYKTEDAECHRAVITGHLWAVQNRPF